MHNHQSIINFNDVQNYKFCMIAFVCLEICKIALLGDVQDSNFFSFEKCNFCFLLELCKLAISPLVIVKKKGRPFLKKGKPFMSISKSWQRWVIILISKFHNWDKPWIQIKAILIKVHIICNTLRRKHKYCMHHFSNKS